MRVQYLLLGLFVCFEIANFTGFSWTRLRRLSDGELLDAAIRYNYPGVYSNLAEFKADYSSFNPEVNYWADPTLTGDAGNQFFNKFLGYKLFNVRLPDAVVFVASNGFVRFSRSCSDYAGSRCSPLFAPDRPKLGIVGTVQDGPPSYDVAKSFSVQWVNGSEGSIFISGHCFAAFSQSAKPVLRIQGASEDDALTIQEFGFRLIVIPNIKRAGYSSMKISEQEFARSQTCDPAVRAKWPNVGGGSWKR